MATRFYLPSTGPAIVAPAFDSSWEDVGPADRVRMVTTKSNSSLVARSNKVGSWFDDCLVRQYVSDPIDAQTITGTCKGIIQVKESIASASQSAQMVIRVVSNDGSTVRGTLLAADGGSLASEFATTYTNRKFPKAWGGAGAAVSSVAASANDRIVVEVGFHAGSGYLFPTGYLKLGDPTAGSDLAENETDTSSGTPWIEFSFNIAFAAGGAPSAGASPQPLGTVIGLPRKNVEWRVFLCDLLGVPIGNGPITRVARDKEMSFVLNRPAAMTFVVPSSDALIKTIHTDGDPLLAPKNRTVKAYRKEGSSWVLRFNGTVEDVEDAGTTNDQETMVTVFDPMHHLTRRLCRNGQNGAAHVEFTDTDAAQIARTLVDRANVIDSTGIVTAEGTFETTADRTVSFDWKMIATALVELAESFNGIDVVFEPVDRTDGVLVRMSCYSNYGRSLEDVIIAYDSPPATGATANRRQSGSEMANFIYGLGTTGQAGDTLTVDTDDSTSIAKYRRHEAVSTYNDVNDSGYLQAIIDQELLFRKNPKTQAVILPIPGRAPEPWSHYWIGDTVTVRASSKLRGGFTGTQRVYGLTIRVGEDAVETVTQVQVAPS